MKQTTYVAILIMLLCVACKTEHDHRGRTPLVEVDGNFLYREDLRSALPQGLSADDSLLFARRYIRTWVEDVLLYDKAQANIPDNAEIEQLVEHYRRSLIMHNYQQALIHQQLADTLGEQELTVYYERNRALFRVERPLIKGLFIKVPLHAPRLADVRRWYKNDSQEAVEHLEKYSLQSAVNYEYFYDKWVTASEILDLMPLQVPDADEYIDKNREIELKDTAFHYFLHVSDYLPAGGEEPYEWARGRVKDIVLNLKQVDFMKQVKEDLYQRALDKNKIKDYSIEPKE